MSSIETRRWRARDEFRSRGYEGTSMADLVAALGIASARIYAAFGSKEDLFRGAVGLYESGEGGFARRALAEEPTARQAIERMLREAVETYTRPGRPRGCMVVSAAINLAAGNDQVREWLSKRRKTQTTSIIDRLKQAVNEGELASGTDPQLLGDYFTAVMHGLSVQAGWRAKEATASAVQPGDRTSFRQAAPLTHISEPR